MNCRNTLILLFFLGIVHPAAWSQTWRWQSRFDISLLSDDNVFESLTGSSSDQAGRLLLRLSAKGTQLRRVNATAQYLGGFEGYTRFSEENRMIHDASAACSVRLGGNFSARIGLGGKSKTFFQSTRGYRYWTLTPSVIWAPVRGVRTSLFASFAGMDWLAGRYFDTTHQRIGLTLSLEVRPGFTVELRSSLGEGAYQRNAFTSVETDSTIDWMDLGVTQKDNLREVTVSMEWYGWALVQVNGMFQQIKSNSYGYAYTQPEFSATVVKPIPWKLSLALRAVIRWKRYTDSLRPLFQIRPDTENEESSYVVADLSRDISRTASCRIRLGWYRNESPFRNLFYEKQVVSLGLTQRF